MIRKCIGCGNIFEGKDGELCPKPVGLDQYCGCLTESVEEFKPLSVEKKLTSGDVRGTNGGH